MEETISASTLSEQLHRQSDWVKSIKASSATVDAYTRLQNTAAAVYQPIWPKSFIEGMKPLTSFDIARQTQSLVRTALAPSQLRDSISGTFYAANQISKSLDPLRSQIQKTATMLRPSKSVWEHYDFRTLTGVQKLSELFNSDSFTLQKVIAPSGFTAFKQSVGEAISDKKPNFVEQASASFKENDTRNHTRANEIDSAEADINPWIQEQFKVLNDKLDQALANENRDGNSKDFEQPVADKEQLQRISVNQFLKNLFLVYVPWALAYLDSETARHVVTGLYSLIKHWFTTK